MRCPSSEGHRSLNRIEFRNGLWERAFFYSTQRTIRCGPAQTTTAIKDRANPDRPHLGLPSGRSRPTLRWFLGRLHLDVFKTLSSVQEEVNRKKRQHSNASTAINKAKWPRPRSGARASRSSWLTRTSQPKWDRHS